MAAKSVEEILEIRQKQYDKEKNLKKSILRDVMSLDGKFSYDDLLNMSSSERNLLGEICQDISAEQKGTEIFRN